jgi:hypothetical protein
MSLRSSPSGKGIQAGRIEFVPEISYALVENVFLTEYDEIFLTMRSGASVEPTFQIGTGVITLGDGNGSFQIRANLQGVSGTVSWMIVPRAVT